MGFQNFQYAGWTRPGGHQIGCFFQAGHGVGHSHANFAQLQQGQVTLPIAKADQVAG